MLTKLNNTIQTLAGFLVKPVGINFSSGNKDEIISFGQKLAITCKAVGYPEPTYRLYQNGTKLAKYNNGEYDLCSTKFEDSGIYKCVAENSLGNVTKSFILTVSGIGIFTHI